MPSLSSVSRLLSGNFSNSSSNHHACPSSQTFSLYRSPKDPRITLIRRANDTTPLYVVTTNMEAKPQLQISRLSANGSQQIPIGAATLPTLFSATKVTLGNLSFSLKQDLLTGDSYSFTFPPLPQMKWRSGLSGRRIQLSDGSGTKVAKCQVGLPVLGGANKLEVLVPCDDFMLDLIVVSGMTAAQMTNMTEEAAGEIVQALVGL